MADIAITATSVVGSGSATRETGSAGEAITAGQAVYLDSATNKYKLSDANATGAKTVRGIALNGAALNQPVVVQKDGPITIGATLVAGTTYCLSATAGGICPQADLTTGDDVVVIGVAASTSVLNINIQTPGVTL